MEVESLQCVGVSTGSVINGSKPSSWTVMDNLIKSLPLSTHYFTFLECFE